MLEPMVPPDSHHLLAAQGWLELGNHVEASQELQKITPRLLAHPYVVEMRWQIYAGAKDWDAALATASSLVEMMPENLFGWIHRSFALHELKRTAEARDNLMPVLDRFYFSTNPELIMPAGRAKSRSQGRTCLQRR